MLSRLGGAGERTKGGVEGSMHEGSRGSWEEKGGEGWKEVGCVELVGVEGG